jgi:type VI secretion system ImpJ/VasE family protein
MLTSNVSPVLSGFLAQLQGLLHHRAEALAGRVSETATRGAAEIADYLLLQLCNRYEPLVTHLAATTSQLHPEDFYKLCVSLAGELATFTESRKRPPVFPSYRHDDLHATFRPVFAALRQALSAVLEQTAVPITLQERKFGIRVGPILDRSLVTDATWVLAVKAQMPPETADQCSASWHCGARAAGCAAPAALLRRHDLFRARPLRSILGRARAIGRNSHTCRRRYAGHGNRMLGHPRIAR